MFNFSEYTSIDYGYFYIAIAGSVFLLLQFVFTFISLGDSFDMDADYDGEFDGFDFLSFGLPFNLFSIRGIVAFIAVFGWTGLSISRSSELGFLGIFIISLIAGLIMLFLVALIYYAAHRLGESGNVELDKAIGKQCEVYIPIPANNSGIGKVQIVLNNALRELEAITSGQEIASGEIVTVISILNDKLVVEKINK